MHLVTFILVLLVSLLLIWLPHIRQSKLIVTEEADIREKTNLALFNERVVMLNQDLNEGAIDQAEFETLKQELELSLLQDIKQGEDESLTNKIERKNFLWPLVMSILLASTSAYVYAKVGNYSSLDSSFTTNSKALPVQFANQIKALEAKIESNPSDAQSIFELGYSYMNAGMFDDSIRAFDQVMKVIGQEPAEILGPKATALYRKSNQIMTSEVKNIVDAALKQDPTDPATLDLLINDAFKDGNYTEAKKYLENVLKRVKLSAGQKQHFQSTLDMLNKHMNGSIGADNSAMPGAKPVAATQQAETTQPTTNGALIKVDVSIDPSIKDMLSPTDRVYVYTRPVGSPMPMAGKIITVADLPTSVTISDSDSMGMSSDTLGSKDEIEVVVLISKHGTIMPQSGDLRDFVKIKVADGKASVVAKTSYKR